MKKQILSILLTLCMVLCLVPTRVFAEGETLKEVKVADEAEILAALADNSVDIITLKSDIAVSSTLIVKRTVTLDIYGYMLEISGNGSVIKVEGGGHLTLKDSDLTATYYFTPNADGLWKWGNSGTKTVNGGVIYGGNATDDGGGVYVEAGGTFTMNGGSIVGCQANSQIHGAGGGVKVECKTDPDNGIISNGIFTMNGGAIIGCVARHGGGVEINGGGEGEYGTFTMNGGVIDSCVATDGRGGGVLNDGLFIMEIGGTIKNCKAVRYDQYYLGGGVSLGGDRNILNGTIISGDVVDTQHIFVNGPVTIGADADIRANMFSYGHTIALADGVSNATIYGKITNNSYGGASCYADGLAAVTYQVDGEDYATQILRSGTTALKPDDPVNDGYVFLGWFGGNTAYDFTSPVTGDITLTAKWAKLVDKTADFTASDGGAAAIDLLNSAKTGSEDSTWDNDTKTLTLRGISMATTATTAVKLPDDATVILADGTENRITGGDATVTQDRTYQNQIYIYGIYASGELIIQGETNGTGKLFVNSGEHINSDNAWTYSTALYADGDITVKGGAVTAQGGKASSADCAFSFGVQLSEGHSLSVSGGTLTGIGGESFDTGDPSRIRESFSEGFDICRGNVTVSGSGKLIAETIPDMKDKGLSYGLRILFGNICVSDSAVLTATAYSAIYISYGDLKLSGGKISSYATGDSAAVSIIKEYLYDVGNGNIEVTGGEFECVGGIYMFAYPTAEGKGVLSVTNGKLTSESIYGPNKLAVSGGMVTSGRINAKNVELSDGNLTVREPIHKYPSTGALYAYNAVCCGKLTVSGGTLDAGWDWDKHEPNTLPIDPDEGCPQSLIKILDSAALSGGTVILDTGCAGNTALKVKTLDLSGGVRGSGYTNENGSDAYIQKDGNTPVKFVVYSADYTAVDAAVNKVKTLDKNLYKDFSAVEAAVNAVVQGKTIDEQADVDSMAKAIEDAIAALQYKDADYRKVDAAIAKANALNSDDYKDVSAVQAAINAVVRGKNITEQADVDSMAKAIEDAINTLEKKPAETKTAQGDKSPNTRDKSNLMLWTTLLIISGGIDICTTVVRRKKKMY